MERCERCKQHETERVWIDVETGLCPSCAFTELRELRAIVEKLPTTADGVPVTPGMKLFLLTDECIAEMPSGAVFSEDGPFGTADCYSTRPAAENARKGEGNENHSATD